MLVVVGREAATGREIELPVVHLALEHPVVHGAEPFEIGAQMRAPLLDHVLAAPKHLVDGLREGRVVALTERHALDRQGLEERVHVFVVRALPMGLEATGEKEIVDPVLDVAFDQRLDQRAVEIDAMEHRLVLPLTHLPGPEIDEDTEVGPTIVSEEDQHVPVDPAARQRREVEQRLDP